ncbi:DUF6279 family lipoprotein [Metapseudomonas boanensis]|uniref:Lipoprotein n=1 Tax=Metapseudomonas boanensis TaxID=2822138 RepID=A0ABS5XGK5_9GAMM|nr:DUF6279 family lipoprotein [Pseudomonas boanensis]MBT8766829.1 hypothetical protein [Pseudomonas boanensis]
MSGPLTIRQLLICIAALLLAACSRLDLAYRNLDLAIPWWIDSYVSLDDAQEEWLEPRLQQHLAWHCRTQLPNYVDWLTHLRELANHSRLEAKDLREETTKVRSAIQTIAVEITPSAISLAESLTPRQLGELYVSLDEKNVEIRKKYLVGEPEELIEARSRRMEHRIRDWLGSTSERQSKRIRDWASSQSPYDRAWVENRELWQRELRAALYVHRTPDFARRLTLLLQQPEAFWTREFREAFEPSEQELASLLADLFNAADSTQRYHLRERLSGMISDLRNQSCYPK